MILMVWSKPEWGLKYDNNQATFGLDGAKEAVIGPDKEIYLLDGHHTFTASLLAGAKSFPVKIVKNYAQEKLSMAAFRQDLLQQEHIYLTNPVTGVEGSLKFDFSPPSLLIILTSRLFLTYPISKNTEHRIC